MNGIEMIENIAKDIRDREDKEMAMAFTNVIGTLLLANGVAVETSKYEFRNEFQQDKNKYMIEKEYGIIIEGLDFTEHDRELEEKIETLERKIEDRNSYITKLKHDLKEQKNKPADAKKTRETNGVVLPAEPLDVAKILATETMHYTNRITGVETECRKYEIKDLEQIAEHLRIYCEWNKEDE